MSNALLGLSIFVGFVASILWLCAACIKVPTNLSSGYGGMVEGLDEMGSAFGRQAKWNSSAAIATSAAALFQAFAMWLA